MLSFLCFSSQCYIINLLCGLLKKKYSNILFWTNMNSLNIGITNKREALESSQIYSTPTSTLMTLRISSKMFKKTKMIPMMLRINSKALKLFPRRRPFNNLQPLKKILRWRVRKNQQQIKILRPKTRKNQRPIKILSGSSIHLVWHHNSRTDSERQSGDSFHVLISLMDIVATVLQPAHGVETYLKDNVMRRKMPLSLPTLPVQNLKHKMIELVPITCPLVSSITIRMNQEKRVFIWTFRINKSGQSYSTYSVCWTSVSLCFC